jgi:hypothetical protein
MILIASEQLWPNLHALVHWSRIGQGLDRIHILHTQNQNASVLPAVRLHGLLTKKSRGQFRYKMLAPLEQVDTHPQGVAQSIAKILATHPESPWVIVANGGLKTMTLGLINAMRRPNVTVVYREVDSGWQRVEFINEQVVTSTLSEIRAEEMDQLPVESLVSTQHVGSRRQINLERQAATRLDVVAIARNCMTDDGWDWLAGFSSQKLPQAKLGDLFEQWCGALFRELGVKNLTHGLKISTEQKLQTAESDLLAIFRGKFYFFELKLIDEEDHEERGSLIDMLRKATTNCKNFAGNHGIPVLLLPNRLLSDQEQQLIPLFSPQPKVLDASVSGQFISWIAKLLEIDQIPEFLLLLESEIQSWMQNRKATRAFGRESPIIRRGGKDSLMPSIDAFAEAIKRERGQNWLLMNHNNTIHFQIPAATGLVPNKHWIRSAKLLTTSCRYSPELIADLRVRFSQWINKKVPETHLMNAWSEVTRRYRH